MKAQLLTILLVSCAGCYTLPLWTPSCSHTDQSIYEFKTFSDGHHFVFSPRTSKLAASVNTKDGFLTGKFEIYYDTGILKYWGMLDKRGHVVSGRYNEYSHHMSYDEGRSMTIADKQNAQTELVVIMQTGIVKEGVTKSEGVSSSELHHLLDSQSPVVKDSVPTLFDCAHSTFRPVAGSVYRHDGKGLQVFQSLDDGVMVTVKLDLDSARFMEEAQTKLDIVVETTMKYVDNELLALGKYEYVGPYTYETVNKEERTIRHFKQVE